MTIETSTFAIDCTGDACAGDVILFTEAVFGGPIKKPKFMGERRVAARIVRDSYGAAKQQHTFTVEVIESDGYDALTSGMMTRRKGRTVYRNGTKRQAWPDEAARKAVLDEKHARGDAARAIRAERKRA